jgi:hypothetical protein
VWVKRMECDKLLVKDWKALHGGEEGFQWRLLLLIRSMGFIFWAKLLMTEWFKRYVTATIQREVASDSASMKRIVRSLVARSRIAGSTQALWQKLHMELDDGVAGQVMHLSTGDIMTNRSLMSSYMHEKALFFLHSQEWWPKAYAGPEIVAHFGDELKTLGASAELLMEIKMSKVAMHDFGQYFACLLKLVMEVPHIREHLVWFEPEGTPKYLHWELGFEGDGFPPGCFEFLLKLFNLGRLSSHEDFNLTLLVGEMDEKGDVATVLSHLLDHEYEKIRVGGLGVEFDVPPGTFPGCTGKAVYHCTVGDTGKGDLAYVAAACGNGTCSSNRPEFSRRLDLAQNAKYDASTLDHPRISVEQHSEWAEAPEAARASAVAAAAAVGEVDESVDARAQRIKDAGQAAAARVAAAGDHNQVHGRPIRFIARNVQHDGLHLTESTVAKFTHGAIQKCTDADENDRRAGTQARTKSYGSHVGRLLGFLNGMKHCKKIAQRIANKWSPDKRVRDEESSWRFNGAAARSVLSNYHVLDDLMEVGLRHKRHPSLMLMIGIVTDERR